MDDMIKVGGLWVSPIEIENRLMEHARVREAAVVGMPVEGLLQIKAFVIPEGEPQTTFPTSYERGVRRRCSGIDIPR